MSTSKLQRLSFLAAFLLAAPMVSLAAAVCANGTFEAGAGSCASPGTLSAGGSTSGTFDFFITLADTDKYFVSGSFAAQTPPTGDIAFTVDPVYIGNATHTASGADKLTFDLFQDYSYPAGAPNGTYQYFSILQAIGAAGGSTESNLFYNGNNVGLLGPYSGFTPMKFSASTSLSGLGTTLDADFQFIYNVAAGSAPVPEPADAGLLALGLLAFAIPAFLRRKRTRAVVE